MAMHVARVLAEDGAESAGVTTYLGIAAIITALGGLIASVGGLIRTVRAPTKHDHDDKDEGDP